MSTEIVEQLKNGVVVRLGDGTEVHCKPLMLGDAITFLDLWAVRADLKAQPAERVRARFMIAKAFHKAYPELADKITVADVEAVLPGFFLGRERRRHSGDSGRPDWDAAFRAYVAGYGRTPNLTMPYVEFVLHIEARALARLEFADDVLMALSNDPTALMHRTQLRTIADG